MDIREEVYCARKVLTLVRVGIDAAIVSSVPERIGHLIIDNRINGVTENYLSIAGFAPK